MTISTGIASAGSPEPVLPGNAEMCEDRVGESIAAAKDPFHHRGRDNGADDAGEVKGAFEERLRNGGCLRIFFARRKQNANRQRAGDVKSG